MKFLAALFLSIFVFSMLVLVASIEVKNTYQDYLKCSPSVNNNCQFRP